jgi:hypothetical protein
MTKQEFFNLKPTKSTINKLQSLSSKGFKSMDVTSFEHKYWVFFGEIAQSLRDYYKLPKAIRDIKQKPTIQKLYDDLVRIKSYGYRKELQIPYTA